MNNPQQTQSKHLKFLAKGLAFALSIYFLWYAWSQIKAVWNSDTFSSLSPRWELIPLVAMFYIGSALMESILWAHLIQCTTTSWVRFSRLFYLHFTSAILRYLPGKFWPLLMQMRVMKQDGGDLVTPIGVHIIMYVGSISASLFFVSLLMIAEKTTSFLQSFLIGFGSFLIIGCIAPASVYLLSSFKTTFLSLKFPIIEAIVKLSTNRLHLTISYVSFICIWTLYYASCMLLVESLLPNVGFMDAFKIAIGMGISIVGSALIATTSNGLGVREGLAFFVMKSLKFDAVILSFPLFIRAIEVVCDGILSSFGFYFLYRKSKSAMDLEKNKSIKHFWEVRAAKAFDPTNSISMSLFLDSADQSGWKNHYINQHLNRLFIEALDPQPTDHVLEIGSGSGRVSELIADYVGTATGVDIAQNAVNACQNNPQKKPNTNYVLDKELDPSALSSINKIFSVWSLVCVESSDALSTMLKHYMDRFPQCRNFVFVEQVRKPSQASFINGNFYMHYRNPEEYAAIFESLGLTIKSQKFDPIRSLGPAYLFLKIFTNFMPRNKALNGAKLADFDRFLMSRITKYLGKAVFYFRSIDVVYVLSRR